MNCAAAPASALWPMWERSDETNQQIVDHSKWQKTLDAHLQASPDGVNRFDYSSAAKDAALLNEYIRETTALDPRQLNKAEQMAYWINLYNAVTVQLVLGYPKKDSILKMKKRLLAIGPWNEELVSVAGEAVTLNDIEHRILRPIWKDHRIHFAVNCASIGCPNLNKQAYTSENLQRLLADGERAYLSHPRGAALLPDGSVQLSSIFKWYREDFADSEDGLLRYVAKHNPEIGKLSLQENLKVKYDYDWSLNSVLAR